MKEFAGASNGIKSVTFMHGDHLKYAPSTITDWSNISSYWLDHAPVGIYFLEGEKISNFSDQWVIAIVQSAFQ